MTPDIIAALINAPFSIVMVYLIVRQQDAINKLLAQICEIQQQHAKDLLDLSMRYADKFLLREEK